MSRRLFLFAPGAGAPSSHPWMQCWRRRLQEILVCLGYPLCAMGDRDRLRDEVLRALRTPILFVQGTRDTLCPLDLLAGVRSEMEAPNILHVVEGGDHSLGVGKRQLQADGETQKEVDHRILESIARFVHSPC